MANTSKVDIINIESESDILNEMIYEIKKNIGSLGGMPEEVKNAWSGDAAEVFCSKLNEKVGELTERVDKLQKFYDYIEDYSRKLREIDCNSDI